MNSTFKTYQVKDGNQIRGFVFSESLELAEMAANIKFVGHPLLNRHITLVEEFTGETTLTQGYYE